MKKLLYFSFLIFACLSSCNNVATLSSSNAQQTDCSSLNIERIISESSNAFESSSFANHESSSFVQLENHVSFEKLSINDKENNFFCDSTLNGLHFVGKPRETKVYTFDSFYLDPGWYKISGLDHQNDETIFFQLMTSDGNSDYDRPICKQIGTVPFSSFFVNERIGVVPRVLVYKDADIDVFANITLVKENKEDDPALKNHKPLVTFTDDDGKDTFFDNWVPIIEKHNIPVSCAIITGRVGQENHLTWDRIETLSKSFGVEFLNHSENHNLNNMYFSNNESYINNSLKSSIDSMENHGFNSEVFVYPGSTGNNGTFVYCVSNLFKYAINASGGYADKNCSKWLIPRVTLDESNSFNYYKTIIDDTIKTRSWLIFVSHSLNQTFSNNQIELIEKIIDYCDINNITICNFHNGVKERSFC